MKMNEHNKIRTIAVILADTEGPYNSQIWSDIQLAARKNKINVIVFEGRALNQEDDEYQHNLIYDLAAKFPCEGYIIFSSHIANYVSVNQLVEFTRRFTDQSIPVVSLSLAIPEAVNLLVDNEAGMRELIRHCVDVHQYRRFAFIGGPENHGEAMERKRAFDEELTKNQIEIFPELVFHGDFSPRAGYQAVKKIVEKNLMPVDCIICANDESAMGAYMYLREQTIAGNDVPFPPVTGFDNTRNSQISRPGITTVDQPFSRMINDAVRFFTEGTFPKSSEGIIYSTDLIIRDSCGCKSSKPALFSDDLFFRSVRNYRVHQYMQTFSMSELFSKTSELLSKCGIGDCFIVMYEKPVNYPETNCVPDKSQLVFAWQNNEDRTSEFGNDLFPTSRLLPDCCKTKCRQKNMIVKPLHFTNEHLGYMVFEPIGEDTRNYEPIRGQLSNSLKIISLLIEQQEMSNRLADAVAELQKHNEKLNVLSLRDELTGLYNRRGFSKAARRFMEQQHDNNVNSLFIYVDIDRMKMINDVYGHAAGDMAIRMTASVLKMSVREEDIIARIGGDEFVILARNISPELIPNIHDRINKLLVNYNEGSNHEWELSISCGTVSFIEGTVNNVEALMEKADARLYEEKNKKKNMASDPVS